MKASHRALAAGVLLAVAAFGCTKPQATSAKADAKASSLAVQAGLKAHKAGKLKEAKSQYLKALELNPKNKFALYDLGVLEHTSDWTSAERRYRAALEIDPEFVDALYNLALLRIDLAPREAGRLLTEVLAKQPNHAGAHYNLARVLNMLHERDLANTHYKRASELDSRIPLETARP